MKERIRVSFITTCVSYTLVLLLQTILFNSTKQTVSNDDIINIFFICVFINLLINFTHSLDLKGWLIDIISILEITFVVTGVNFFMGANVSILNMLVVFIIAILLYFICNAVVFIKNCEDAKKINEKIKYKQKSN